MWRRPTNRLPKSALALALALALATAVVTAGCGGGDDAQRLTRAEFIARADAICKATSTKLSALPEPQGLEEFAQQARAVITVSANALASFRKLVPPPELEPQVAQMTALVAKQVELASALAAAADKQDANALETLASTGNRLSKGTNEVAREIGLKECGR